MYDDDEPAETADAIETGRYGFVRRLGDPDGELDRVPRPWMGHGWRQGLALFLVLVAAALVVGPFVGWLRDVTVALGTR